MRRLVNLVLAAILAGSIFYAFRWWAEANAPMTAERYAALCGNQSECYPEIAFGLGVVAAAFVGLISAFALLLRNARQLAALLTRVMP